MKVEKRYLIEKRVKSLYSGAILIVTLLGEKYLELGSTNTQHAGEE